MFWIFWGNKDGAVGIEYGLILALIVITIVSAISNVADSMTTQYEEFGSAISTVTP